MSQVNCIRDKRKDGCSIAKIARELSIDEKTVRKYLQREDYSPKLPEMKARKNIQGKLLTFQADVVLLRKRLRRRLWWQSTFLM